MFVDLKLQLKVCSYSNFSRRRIVFKLQRLQNCHVTSFVLWMQTRLMDCAGKLIMSNYDLDYLHKYETKMHHFLWLPDKVFKDILARIDDIPQLVSLRGLSHRWRQVIMSPQFAAFFIAQEHPIDYPWVVILGFDDSYPLGVLTCIELSELLERRHTMIPMNDVFEEDVENLSLLAADGSLVLFKCVANGITSLRVLNLFNMVVREVHVPVYLWRMTMISTSTILKTSDSNLYWMTG